MKIKPILLDLPMPITTPRLLLRPPQIGDGKVVNKAALESFDALHEFLPWAREKQSLEESEEFVRLAAANWIKKKNDEPWLPIFIFDKESGEFIGATGYHSIDWDIPRLEIGYWIDQKYSGKGLMTEAVNALTRYAFKQLKAKRVEIKGDITNIKSSMVPARLNYELEAVLKLNRRKLSNNELSDTFIYAIFDESKLPDLKVNW